MSRLLIVDDDANVRAVLRRFLETAGYDIAEAGSAEAAASILAAEQPDVAFCDIHMAGASGLWLADQIRKLSPTTALVLATGDTELPAAETLRPGIVAYLLKPLTLTRVVAAATEGVAWSREAAARARQRGVRGQLDSGTP
jgi:DNA-binding NtrC family response regulator